MKAEKKTPNTKERQEQQQQQKTSKKRKLDVVHTSLVAVRSSLSEKGAAKNEKRSASSTIAMVNI
jgi:hypothetical protein